LYRSFLLLLRRRVYNDNGGDDDDDDVGECVEIDGRSWRRKKCVLWDVE
jgi:hypothetical protein